MFKRFLSYEKTLQKNPTFAELLESELEAQVDVQALSKMQKRAAVCLLAAGYQFFGFAVFGPLGREFLAEETSLQTGIEKKRIVDWSENIAYALLEDFNVLQLVDGEPDWNEVDEVFALDFWKRLFCSSELENDSLGMVLFSEKFIIKMRSISSQALESLLGQVAGQSISEAIEAACVPLNGLDPAFVRAFRICLDAVASDQMRLFLWRIDVFSKFKETRQEFKFVLKSSESCDERRLMEIAAMMIALSDLSDVSEVSHLSVDGGLRLFPESPLGVKDLQSIFSQGSKNQKFPAGMQILRVWGTDNEAAIQAALEFGFEIGLLFRIFPKNNLAHYGLTTLGCEVLKPFLSLVKEELLVNGAPEVEQKTDLAKSTISANEQMDSLGSNSGQFLEELSGAAHFLEDLQNQINKTLNEDEKGKKKRRQSSKHPLELKNGSRLGLARPVSSSQGSR